MKPFLRRSAAVVHRQIWQRLPKDLRRAMLVRTASLLAPRPDPQQGPGGPLFIVGVFRTASGLGESARLCYEACRALGFETYAIDVSAGLMQPLDLPHYSMMDGQGHTGPGTVIMHVNASLIPLASVLVGRRFLRRKRIVGYWAWELEGAPREWRFGPPFVHEAWVPSTFTAHAVRKLAPGLPVRVVPYPITVRSRPRTTCHKDRFRVLTIFNCASSFARKNPCAAVAAFRQAFGADPDTELIVKSSNLEAYPPARALLDAAIEGQSNITHIENVVSWVIIEALYDKVDAVLSLHRSEGFGLTLAEAMMRGIPVIATDWSGNVDFMNEQNACPVGCTLVPACDPQRIYHYPNLRWADPDVAHAAAHLRRLRTQPDLRSRIGHRAAHDVAGALSLDVFAAHVRAALDTSAVDPV